MSPVSLPRPLKFLLALLPFLLASSAARRRAAPLTRPAPEPHVR